MFKAFQSRWFAPGYVLFLGMAGGLAQDPPDQSEGPLFVPIVPGQPSPLLPVPRVTPLPFTSPVERGIPPVDAPPPFVPTEIPPPAIQSGPVTSDYIPPADRIPSTPRVIPSATPRPTPRPSQPTAPRAKTTPSSPVPGKMSQAEVSRLAESASRTRNAKTAELLGWHYYNKDDFSAAAYWFEQAGEWSPGSEDALYGLALAKLRSGELTTAENLAKANRANPKMITLLGDIYSRRATEAYELGRFKQSIRFFDQTREYRPLSRNEQIVLAWAYRESNQPVASAALFEKLYRENPDRASAEGLYSSLTKLKNYDKLNEIAETVPGPLEGVYETADPQNYYKAGLYRAAFDTEGEKVYPILENLNSPSLEMGFGYSQKSGQEGESALTEVVAPYLEARFYPANRNEIMVRISRISLDAGNLSEGANVGTPPLEFAPYSYTPTTQEDGLFDFRLRWEYQDWVSPYIEIGTTPIGGPLQSRPVGRAGVTYRHMGGYVQGEFYSRSIKQSMLSYVGIVDPYTGNTWGRVTETGFAASVFQTIAPDWTIFAGGSVAQITGEDVQNNDRVAFTLALAKELNVDGFEYFTLGPAVSYEAYSNNQNFFTYGHGGYFSPDYILQGVFGANFLTMEGEQWLIRGAGSVGLQTNQQNSAPYFPLNPDGRTYPGSNSSTGVFLLEADGGILINDNWMLGATAAYTVTADYNAGWASIYVRYFFEPRKGLLRSDLTSGALMFR